MGQQEIERKIISHFREAYPHFLAFNINNWAKTHAKIIFNRGGNESQIYSNISNSVESAANQAKDILLN